MMPGGAREMKRMVSLDGVRRGLRQVLNDSAQEGGVRDVILVAKRVFRGEDADVELLSQVMPIQCHGPQVPHSCIVERRHDGCPRVRVHLDRVPAHRVHQIVVLPLLWAPRPRFDTA